MIMEVKEGEFVSVTLITASSQKKSINSPQLIII